MGKISLYGLEFFAYHGFYKEERKIGNKYIVNVTITADISDASESDALSQTIDYEKLYKIIATEMAIPSKLLENIALRVSDKIFNEFSTVEAIEISVSKQNPPIGGICNRAEVMISRNKPT